MANIKIINIQKSDSYDDVTQAVKGSTAGEVILIFPKGSKFSKDESLLASIKDEADTVGKTISVMTNDPILARLAQSYNLDLLSASPKEKNTVENFNDDSVDGEEGVTDRENSSEEPGFQADLAMARYKNPLPPRGRSLDDIIVERPARDLNLDDEDEEEEELEVEVLKKSSTKKGDIASIWSERRHKDRKVLNFGRFKKIILWGAVTILFLLVLIIFSAFSKATITIIPQKQELDFQLKVSASTETPTANYEFNRIPGQLLTAQHEAKRNSPVTGEKELVQKASGKITIYNKSSSSQRLVATTRFESPDGLVFRIPQTLTVPAAVGSVPGSIESIVTADRPGPDYNIQSARFSIPGFKGSPKFEQFFAESKEPMKGGLIGLAKIVTEKDFNEAREQLTAEVREQVYKILKNQVGSLKIIETAEVKLNEPSVNAKFNEPAEKLEMSIKGSLQTIAFKESDVLEIIKNYLSENGNLKTIENRLSLEYLEPVISGNNKNMTFAVKVRGLAATALDENKFIKDVPGMNEDAIREYFKSQKEIESARVVLTPFWVKRVPRDTARIKVVVNED